MSPHSTHNPLSSAGVEYELSPLISGIHIRTATLHGLVYELITCFEITRIDYQSGELNEERRVFVDTLLQMHKWFTSSIEMFTLLTGCVADNQLKENTTPSPSVINIKNRPPDLQIDLRDSVPCTCSNPSTRHRNNNSLNSCLSKSTEYRIANRVPHTPFSTMSKSISLEQGISDLSSAQHAADDDLTAVRNICYVLRYWMQTFPLHFDSDAELYEAVRRYKNDLRDTESHLSYILESCDVPSFDWMRKVTVKNCGNATVRYESHTKVSLVFQNLAADDLARHLSYLDYKACRRISFTDYEAYAKTASIMGIARLERSVAIMNGLTQWVQLMVLSKTTPKQRAHIIGKFIKVAQHLRHLRSYNTLMAVIGGITHSSLARLHKTYNHLSADSHKVLDELKELISSTNNYQNYRKALSLSHDHYCVLPIIGVHLKDIIALHVASADTVGDPPFINFRKMAQLSTVISCVTVKLQSQTPQYPVNTDLIDTIKLAIDVFYSDEEIFELSLAREPRNTSATNSANTLPPAGSGGDNSPLLSEWKSGLKPPDVDTINKHVSNMVTAMFKNYDDDKDGHISIEDFERISSNFPFLESFCVLDTNGDGLVSEKEVKKYFMLAKCNSLKSSFKHNFTETTYFKLTYCDHCSGLLWGLIKQGWKCKDCAINAHKSCKDITVTQCKVSASSSTHKNNSGSTSATRRGSISHRSSISSSIYKTSSISSLTSSISPLTPADTSSLNSESSHSDSKFTFSRKSLRNWRRKQAMSSPTLEHTLSSSSLEDKTLCSISTFADSCATQTDPIPDWMTSANEYRRSNPLRSPQLQTDDYKTLYEATEKVLKEERREKDMYREWCVRSAAEIRGLKRQLTAIRNHTVSLLSDTAQPDKLSLTSV